MSERHQDVLIIGAGVGGSVCAKHLAEAGFSVVCLEQGDWVNASDYPGAKAEFELLAQRRWNPNPNIRSLPQDYPVEDSQSDLDPRMFNAVGGSSILYSAHWVRQLPSDFRARSLDGVADDWPLSYQELAPYYEQVERDVGVAGLGGDPAYPPGAAPPLPAHAIGKIGRKAAEGLNTLGWHWWPAWNAIASAPYGHLAQCERYGTCMAGCPAGAKGSFDLTHWPSALEHGARLVTGARVRRIETNDRGLATGATFIDRGGGDRFQPADVVILAANGIGTPRLLLLSASLQHPAGLANSSGLVGKRLMLHPYASVVGVYDDDLESWLGPAGHFIQSLQFYESDETRGFLRGAKWSARPTGGPLNVLLDYGVEDAVGSEIHRLIRERLGHCFEWGVIAEDLPDEDNRVVLDDRLKDSDGVPAPRLIYRVSEDACAMLDWHLARVTEAHQASGATETITVPLMRYRGGHLLGTARMGSDPARSVVNPFGRAHDCPNLFVSDGSVFPTSSGVNPTATIAALALRCAEHVVTTARLQAVPA